MATSGYGMPRSAVNELRGVSFAQMPGKIVILDQYNRLWRDIWMDGHAPAGRYPCDRLLAHHADALRAGRPAIDQDESHFASLNKKR